MTLGPCVALRWAILGQVKLCCPEPSFLDRTQGRYIGYAGIEIGSIPASHCVSTLFYCEPCLMVIMKCMLVEKRKKKKETMFVLCSITCAYMCVTHTFYV